MKERNLQKAALTILFWGLSFFILFKIFTKDYNNGPVDYLYTLLFHVPIIFLVHLHWFVIKKFFVKQLIIKYLLTIICLTVSAFAVHKLVFGQLSTLLFTDYYFVSFLSNAELLLYFVSYLIASLMISLSFNWYRLKENQIWLERENRNIQLNSLKSQLNPHFLFNSLNNIYALLGETDNLSKKYLVHLSDALRYMLYRTNKKKVSLQEELDYIINYISLERLRLEEDSTIICHMHIPNAGAYQIAPLLFLPIVENAFKHVDKENIHIEIHGQLKGDVLKIKCQNSFVQDVKPNIEGGIGLTNLEKRLKLIYDGKFSWTKGFQSELYISELDISLV